MELLASPRADVTRNELGETVLSLVLDRPSGVSDGALLLWDEGSTWRAVLRDRIDRDAAPVLLPPLPAEAGRWILDAPPFLAASDPRDAIPGDPRLPGIRYVLVVETIGADVVGGCAARVTRMPTRPPTA